MKRPRLTTALLLVCLALAAAGIAVAIVCPPQSTAWSQPTKQNYTRGLNNQPHVNLYLNRSGELHGDYYDRDRMLRDGARDIGVIDFYIDDYEETTKAVPFWGEIVTRVQATVKGHLHVYPAITTIKDAPSEDAIAAFGTREAALQCGMPANLLTGASATPKPVDIIPTRTLRWATALAAAALGLFGLTALSLVAVARRARAARRIRAGLCAACAYPLPSGAKCPECGSLT